jgi:hypothetical protein
MAFKSKFTNKHETILWWIKPDGSKAKPKFNVFPVREATKFYDTRNNLFGRNPGNVWEVDRVAFGSTDQTSHIAVFPEEISDRIILATTDENELVLDPFSGSGTVCKVAKSRGRNFLGFEISTLYHHESVNRLSLQARGELLSVLSEIIKEHVLSVGETKRFNTIRDNLISILSPLSLKPYESIIAKPYLDTLCAGFEDTVKKSDKMALWKDLERLLPPFASNKISKDPVGLISLVDCVYMRAYKLHRVYSSAMRFRCAARWVSMIQPILSLNGNEAWKQIIRSIAESESGNFILEHDKITLMSTVRSAKIDSVGQLSPSKSQNESMTPTLFR